MATVDKHLSEIDKLIAKEELTPERKLEFIEKQLEGFETQAYRFQVDVEVAKEYIRIGNEKKEEAYVETGEKKIIESVQALRSIVINIDKLCQIREELKAKYEINKPE